MGKVKAKDRRKRNSRLRPTGLPSVKDSVEEQAIEPSPTPCLPVLAKLTDVSASERQWACHSLLHLMGEEGSRERLIRGGAIGKVAPLLMDQALPVREAASSLLRNLSAMENPLLCQKLSHLDVMTFLSAMLRDSLSGLLSEEEEGRARKEPIAITNLERAETDNGGERDDEASSMEVMESVEMNGRKKRKKKKGSSSRENERRRDVEREQVLSIIDHGLSLLNSMSEQSHAIVDAFNHDGLLSVVMKLLPLSNQVAVSAAQVLLTVIEDNHVCIESLVTCDDHVTLMKNILEMPASHKDGLHWPIKALITGVLCHLLPHLRDDGEVSCVMELVLANHTATLDAGITWTELTTQEKFEEALNIMRAKQVTMEIITNASYTEGDGGDDVLDGGDESDGDGDGDADCEEMEVENEPKPVTISPLLKCFTGACIHSKVWETIQSLSFTDQVWSRDLSTSNNDDNTNFTQNIKQSAISFLTSTLCAFQNLISALPLDEWGDPSNLTAMVTCVFTLLERVSEPASVSGVLVTLLHKLSQTQVLSCITVEEVQLSAKLGLTSESVSVRSDMMIVLSQVGKVTLSIGMKEEGLINIIVSALVNCISQDISLGVVCQALDGVFDIFGDDNCPIELFTSVSLLTVLMQCQSTFKARFQVEKKLLEHCSGLVQDVRTNLPRFIEYTKSRLQNS